jgi:hypothetical protein
VSTPTDTMDIAVRRCSVRVRRTGGWGWGDPETYLPRIAAAIEAALAGVIAAAGLQDHHTSCHLREPVTLHITADGRVTTDSRTALIERLRSAAAVVSPSAPSIRNGTPRADRSEPDPVVSIMPPDSGADSLAVALGRWSRSGRLLPILRSLPAPILHAWLDALARASRNLSQPTQPVSPEVIAAIASAVLPESVAEPSPAHVPERTLLLAGAIIAATGDRLPDASTIDGVMHRAARGVPVSTGADAPFAETHGPRLSPSGTAALRQPTAASTIRGPAVVPALPFLTLIQLARLGFVHPAAAALAAARVPAPAHVFAAAIAGKTLDPPARGWERSEAERAAVRLASGLDQGEVDAGLAEIAATVDIIVPVWRAALVDLYVEGRVKDADVCVTRRGEDRICGEEAGLLPIAWVQGERELQEVLAQLGNPAVRTNDVLRPLFELLEPRRGIAGISAPAVERELGAIVGTAIGSLGQELWGDDADSALTIERLRDLEASVVVADRVTIGVPRGQRWLDLRRAGLLDAWPVPWAPGGIWELVTW